MNGFKLMAESYRKATGISKAEAERIARLYDFLGDCTESDINTLFDSTAFNEISKQYVREAVKRLTANGTIDEEQATAIRNEVSRLYEDMTAAEVMSL